MKGFLLLFFLLIIPLEIWAQFTDDFSDGEFTNNPTWSGNDGVLDIVTDSLHLNDIQASSSYLSTPSEAINDAQWDFFVGLDFNPSSSNFAKVYLVADQADLSGEINGYFVKIGGTTDEVSLFQQTGTEETEIIDGLDDVVDTDPVTIQIRVTRDAEGNWELFSDPTNSSNFTSEGTINDLTHVVSAFFGVSATYTITRADKFFFDDFVVSGNPFVDVFAPTLESFQILSSNQLDLTFSEKVKINPVQNTTNYSVDNGIGSPGSAQRDDADSSLVYLTFDQDFANGILNILSISGIKDLSNNTIIPIDTSFIYFNPIPAVFRSVVINEIFADPCLVLK